MRNLILVLLLACTTHAFAPPARSSQGSLLQATGEEDFDFSALQKPDTPSKPKVTNNKTPASPKNDSAAANGLKNETCQGIGGKDGFVYDVNKLKTNLVQRCVSDYKKQLWDLLGNPDASQEAIEEKLAALVQANPVFTTTDSNLLEGKWSFVFSSAKPAKVLTDTDRFGIGYKSKTPGEIIGTLDGGARRFVLENLDESQDPYVTDRKTWSGVLQRVRYYRVAALTRTSLDLDIFRCSWNLLGYPLWRKRYRTNRQTVQVKILYVDCDLCVSVDQGLDQPFTVYTKSPAWVARTEQLKRKWKKMRSQMHHIKSRFAKHSEENDGPIGVLQDNSIWLEYETDSTKIKVVKLGEIGPPDDEAWEGEEDPFNNLAADDRQAMLKGMEVGEIEAIGKSHQIAAKKIAPKKLSLQRQKSFKKPTF